MMNYEYVEFRHKKIDYKILISEVCGFNSLMINK